MMPRTFSPKLAADIVTAAERAFSRSGAINVPILAEQVRRRNAADNVALEDIEMEMLRIGQRLNAPIEFDRTSVSEPEYMQ